MNQVHEVAVPVIEEYQAVCAEIERLAEKPHIQSLQMFVCGLEIRDCNRQVPDSGALVVLHILRLTRALGRNDFEDRAVLGFDKKIARERMIDPEPEILHVPVREIFGVRRRDRRVFNTLEHKHRLYRGGLDSTEQALLVRECFAALSKPVPNLSPREIQSKGNRRHSFPALFSALEAPVEGTGERSVNLKNLRASA